ncbi:MAG TPA: hypothetical protein VK003_06810 [Oceanobacillus sp.]|nr:hypothetical protein [Oceanobacillus sp.]
MNRIQPNWNSLADINFLVHRRFVEHLNAAIGAVNIIDTPEAGGKPVEFWKKRAIRHIMQAQNLYEAWSMLARHKSGHTTVYTSQFRAGDLLEWLAAETSQNYVPQPDHDRILEGNRETLQEALLLIYSAAHTMGPNVQLLAESSTKGFWFRVRYQDTRRQPRNLEELFEKLDDDWRTGNAAYELARAQDFLELNRYSLHFVRLKDACELGFFVAAAGMAHSSSADAIRETEETIATRPIEDETQPDGDNIRSHFSRRGQGAASRRWRSEG